MGSKTQVTLVDDLDGSAAAETISFSLDNKHCYEIDLSARNAGALRNVVGPNADAGRRLASPRRGRGRPYCHVHTEVDPAAVRTRAIATDYEISARGRRSAAIIDEPRRGLSLQPESLNRPGTKCRAAGPLFRLIRRGR